MTSSTRKYCALGLVFIASFIAGAQEIGPLEADRPDQTETPAIVPHDHLQIESGFTFERASSVMSSVAHPSVLCKYGIREVFEIRLEWEITSRSIGTDHATGMNPIAVGFKVRMLDEAGIVPTTSLIAHVSVPHLASAGFRAKHYAPSARLTMQHSLNEAVSIGYNLGFEWDGESTVPAYLYTLVAGFSLTDAVGCYAELYGFAQQTGPAEHLTDAGMTWLIQNNMMVDISAGMGLTSNAPDFFLGVGFSIRLGD